MSGNIYEVRPGPPQQLQGANFSSGATIYNTDILNSVWISNSQAMSPGNGFQLTPQASLEWSSSKGLPWACVDTGVTDNIMLQYSDDVSNVQNPVGVALAVSAAGIPIKAIQKTLLDSYILPPFQNVHLNVGVYNSLILGASVDITYVFHPDDSTLYVLDAETISSDSPTARIACVGNIIVISNLTSSQGILTVIGSSRPALGRIDTRAFTSDGDYWLLPTTAMSVGNTYQLTKQTAGANLQGPTFVKFQITGQIVEGHFSLVSQNGSHQIIDICDTNSMTANAGNTNRGFETVIYLPPCGYTFTFTCAATGGNAAATVRLISGDIP